MQNVPSNSVLFSSATVSNVSWRVKFSENAGNIWNYLALFFYLRWLTFDIFNYKLLRPCWITCANIFKVTVHLQGCLACKRCSASGLNCRYLNWPYIKLKLIVLAIRLYQKFWKKLIVEFFTTSKCERPNHRLNVTCQSEFFVFRLFNVFLRFRDQSAEKNLSASCHIQFQWKVTEHFRNRVKKIWSVRTKIALIVKIFRKKKFAEKFLLFLC